MSSSKVVIPAPDKDIRGQAVAGIQDVFTHIPNDIQLFQEQW